MKQNTSTQNRSQERPEGNFSIVYDVLDSLRNNYRDYVFTLRDYETVVATCKKENINIIYRFVYDRYNELDYIEFIPVEFYKTPENKRKLKKSPNLQIDMRVINQNKAGWVYKDLSSITKIWIEKNRKPGDK